jgi:hypothetical protein
MYVTNEESRRQQMRSVIRGLQPQRAAGSISSFRRGCCLRGQHHRTHYHYHGKGNLYYSNLFFSLERVRVLLRDS